jgi:ribosomal protein S18 acetylase RimI-like enzyme
LRGIHSAVREDNAAACRFFEKLGFVVLSHHLIILPCGGAFRAHYTAIYGKAL